MNETSIIISGFGGQGALFAGQMLGYTAMDAGRKVTWIPSYGPEMRGGTAHCTVIISHSDISSPLVSNPDVAVLMNLPSLDKYEPLTKQNGVIIANSSLINRELERDDINSLLVPANQIAEDLGYVRLANMVLIGSMIYLVPVVTLEMIRNALLTHVPDRHKALIQLNIKAIENGFALAEKSCLVSKYSN
ncbi:MAG: 2-oxoacid:ferredoxin oxidoreductase subunit gamma [Anaerolineales bacterium]|nr:MAG: 2-oxoacid:ferredoxin oxidoreductase subunit gamma [Anaerolineales bacterium]